ncbi:TPA: PIG-L deacetylase family protein [Klebsiella quasipneumoniae]|nr:GlcNAc-PI de-N-acetylase [Klebsiella pneumoniae]
MMGLFTSKKWLIISPHADDAELGCGGAISRAVENGIDVHIAVITIKGEWHVRNNSYVSSETRRNELTNAMSEAGTTLHIINKINDNETFDLCSSSKSKCVNEIDLLIENIKPDIIFIPVPSFHQEHKWVYECSIAATRPTKTSEFPKSVIAYEYPPAGWGDSGSWSQSSGAIYVDISKHIDKKISILGKHESQMSTLDNALISLDAVRRLASFRGLESGVKYAELFYLLRSKIIY